MQNYCLFHKFHDRKELSDQLKLFFEDKSCSCMNIYSYKADHLWNVFTEEFHFVEASGGVVMRPNGDLLLIRRSDHWDAPKGHFEPGETPEECARREISEECGVTCGLMLKELNPTYHIYRFGKEQFLKMTHWFLFELSGSDSTTPQSEEGITEALWIGNSRLAEVKPGMWSSVRDMVNEVISSREAYL